MVAGERTQFSSCWAPTASRRLGILGMGALGAGAAQGGVPLSHPLCGLPGDGRALNLPGEGLGARASRDCSATSGQVSIPGEGEHRGLTYAGSRSAVGARQFSTTSASDGSSRERSSPIDPSSTAAAPLSPVSPVLRGAASLTRSCQVPTLSVGRHRSFFRVVRRSGFRLFTLWAPRRRLLPSSRGRTAVPFIVHETRERVRFTSSTRTVAAVDASARIPPRWSPWWWLTTTPRAVLRDPPNDEASPRPLAGCSGARA